jgi:hypothetical protein
MSGSLIITFKILRRNKLACLKIEDLAQKVVKSKSSQILKWQITVGFYGVGDE